MVVSRTMDQASFAVQQTPITERSTFTITALDVGSPAVRPGAMAELEQHHQLLLRTSKAVLTRIQNGNIQVGAVFEYALERAIRIAEFGDVK